ncbi:MAG: diguanylate cyclase [Coriobacteriales bacterium]|nr:diguanylate cyclase [Coriobacteriales bacterium]
MVPHEKKSRFHSIRAQITLVAVGSIVVSMVIAAVLGVVAIRSIGRSSSKEMLRLLCESGEKNLDYYFEGVEQSVEMVSAYVESDLDGLDDERLQAHLDRVSDIFKKLTYQNDGILTYYYRIDPSVSRNCKGFWFVRQGDGTFRPHEVTDITQYDTADTSNLVWYTVPKNTGESVWLPPYITENLGARVISYNVPVYYRGTFVGVIGIEIDYRKMAEQVDSITLDDDGYAFVNDEEGTLIYHPHKDTDEIMANNPEVPAGLLGDSQYVTYTYDGVKKQAVRLPLSNGMWLNVCVPMSQINASWVRWGLTIVAVFVVLLGICVVVTLRFASHVTQPLQDLTTAALQVDAGNYDVTLTYDGNNEVGILTRVFKRLVEHMESYIDNLNDLAYVDPLTSVHNKAAFAMYVQNLQSKMFELQEESFAVCVFDCSGLKEVNDLYGRRKGDVYLKTTCSLICNVFQHSPVFRVGGDEFAVVVTHGDFAHRDELMREFVERAAMVNASTDVRWEHVDVAWGMATCDANADETVEDVIRRANMRLDEHKRAQRPQA